MHAFRPLCRSLCITLAIGLPLATLPLTGCGVEYTSTASNATQDAVLTTFYPTQYFAERISGGLVAVESPLPNDEDPIFWRPGSETIAQFQSAKLIITNGAEFEKWVAGAALPRGRTVESISSEALAREGGPITMETTTHSHGPAGEHTHEGIDGHTWVSPELAIVQAERIAEAMSTAWPTHASKFEENLALLVEELEMLGASLSGLTPQLTEYRLFASRPAYNYLARELGWDVHNLDLDPENADSQAIVEAVHDAMHQHEDQQNDHEHDHTHGDKPVILRWEGEPTPAIVEALETELGVTSVLFSPAETAPEAGDYMDEMRANFERLRQAVGG